MGRKIGAGPPLENLKPPLPLPETQKSAFQRGYIQVPPTEQNLTCSLGAARVQIRIKRADRSRRRGVAEKPHKLTRSSSATRQPSIGSKGFTYVGAPAVQ